ncbi:DEAD/DEAH box helicase, partial [uncultured Caballeronia sp.]|uniref:DEAD/DEAH box helicase n=1 Tax=uncultured Caballeronia sp. TaxID=1827198 RepID=UPI0035CB6ADA
MSTPADSRRRSPRPRRVPKTRAAQAKADALAELFQPVPVVIDQDAETTPFNTRLAAWFERNAWQPFPFQREVWKAIESGSSGLLHATTGAGKTWAVWLGALAAYAREQKAPAPLTVLWITPMRALAADTARALQTAVTELAVPWSIGLRTGDTQSAERARQNKRMPSTLVTTPESLTLMLTRANAIDEMKHVRLVVVDEWHELLGNKRGTQTQLAIARLARWRPELQVWGLSATLGNLDLARDALLAPARTQKVSVRGAQPKTLIVDTLIPDTIERFPWGGHLGLHLLSQVTERLRQHATSIVFTNTRSQAELWYRALEEAMPDFPIGLHHGSLSDEVRQASENGL